MKLRTERSTKFPYQYHVFDTEDIEIAKYRVYQDGCIKIDTKDGLTFFQLEELVAYLKPHEGSHMYQCGCLVEDQKEERCLVHKAPKWY